MKAYLWAALSAFVVSMLFCRILIPVLRRLKAGQNILAYVKEHKQKSGTPTMGGLGFITAAVLTAVFFIREKNQTVLIAFAIGISYMIVGLLDDFLKRKHKANLGLKAWQKFTFQFFIAVFAGLYCLKIGFTDIYLPFTKTAIFIGWGIVPLSVFVFVATVNAVNLTDGLDGLAAGTCVPFFACLGILIALQKGEYALCVLCFVLTGALLGYLPFNVFPASVFMGDTGSLALGGFAASIGIFSGNSLYVAVLGILFVFSVITVMLQVIYYKATKGKRIFLMAPIHHHFQKKGFSEAKISYVYFAITLCVGIVCICMQL